MFQNDMSRKRYARERDIENERGIKGKLENKKKGKDFFYEENSFFLGMKQVVPYMYHMRIKSCYS